ncbi:hypothetical protein RI129_003367 [Pyrocoelia pectoralis]|uniref:MD-2-related lipid-recognition domain-containing protein n=1 Tax=Pyrocoelia pectoralis TaxID=417401 RepID=A0AAN7VGU1_9COLE
MQVAFGLLFLCLVICVNTLTPVEKCPKGKSLEDYKLTVKVGNCKKSSCRLKKGRLVVIEFRFTSDRNVKTLTNDVNAIIAGLPFPFIGVDQTPACDNMYEADGRTKSGCKLVTGQEYVYRFPIKILEIYPVIKVRVHWGLKADDGNYVMCFELPASIVT